MNNKTRKFLFGFLILCIGWYSTNTFEDITDETNIYWWFFRLGITVFLVFNGLSRMNKTLK